MLPAAILPVYGLAARCIAAALNGLDEWALRLALAALLAVIAGERPARNMTAR